MRRAAFVLAAILAPLAGAEAQTRMAPASQAQVQLSFAPVVKVAAPAVVNVYGARVERTRRSAAMDEFFRRFFGDLPSTPAERVQRSLGSGVIVDASGLVVTNHHVIAEMTEVKVALPDNREIEAEIVLRDPRTDLAVLKLKPTPGLKALEFGDDDALEVGDIVLAIGNPFGVGRTVTQGIVSGLARTNVGVSDYGYFIQTDAAINPGNSGGALVDMQGRLVGINSAIFSKSGGSVGIGFAIPASMVKVVVDSARAGSRTVRRPYLGASLQAVNQELADGLGLERPTGALVASVHEKSPAEAAGLRRGDVILEVDGRQVDDPDGFGWRFALKGISGEVPVTVNRGGLRRTLSVRLQPAPEIPPRDQLTLRGRSPFSGATVLNASPAVAEEMQLDLQDGVVIADVEDGSLASRIGLQKGDVLLSLNGEKIASTRELDRMARAGAQVWRITISRGGQVMTTVVGG
ncbi:Do family serine endopeptidase [Enterovirga aerilata]|uniref:Do family serine endopeptidase n=1 Tax=Enterovirga aerilata TaxID=2730920 RepID=A0A849I3E2_9HYPH|nr:Do family serine endopeptidase [Enterovirga sp. DB1703]NNM71861.1 Do family serine endopeptidase [Enterovirga sp. DB1703]